MSHPTHPTKPSHWVPQVEVLEERCLLSVFGPLTDEFRVNMNTGQGASQPSIGMDSSGKFLVGYVRSGQVWARFFDPSGTPQGNEFRIDTFNTAPSKSGVSVAMNADGNFVVVWSSYGQDGSRNGIFAQLHNAAGDRIGSEFQVNAYTTNHQQNATVAMDSFGNFVVAWESSVQDPDGSSGVYARRYDAAGEPLSGEFRINSYTTGFQGNPAIAMDPLGNFVVIWNGFFSSTNQSMIYGQRYAADGTPIGDEFFVNTGTFATGPAAVAMDAAGNWVVAWNEFDGDFNGVFARRYEASGAPGPVIQVNTYTTNAQQSPVIGMNAAGEFVIAWESSGQDGSGLGVFAQRFNPSGTKIDGEFQVNTYTLGQQSFPAAVVAPNGNVVLAWSSFQQEGPSSDWNVYGRLFGDLTVTPLAKVAAVEVRGTAWNAALPWFTIPTGADQLRALPWTNFDQIRLVFTEDVSITSNDLEILGVNVSNYSSQVIDFAYDSATHTATWTLNAPIGPDKLRLRLADGAVTGPGGLPLDGEWIDGESTISGDGTAGGAFAFRLNVLPGNADFNGTQVNALDWSHVRAKLFQNFGDADYTLFADINGDGAINALDWNGTRARLFSMLPEGDPAAASSQTIFLAADVFFLDAAEMEESDPANHSSLDHERGFDFALSQLRGTSTPLLIASHIDQLMGNGQKEDLFTGTPAETRDSHDPPRDRNRLGTSVNRLTKTPLA